MAAVASNERGWPRTTQDCQTGFLSQRAQQASWGSEQEIPRYAASPWAVTGGPLTVGRLEQAWDRGNRGQPEGSGWVEDRRRQPRPACPKVHAKCHHAGTGHDFSQIARPALARSAGSRLRPLRHEVAQGHRGRAFHASPQAPPWQWGRLAGRLTPGIQGRECDVGLIPRRRRLFVGEGRQREQRPLQA